MEKSIFLLFTSDEYYPNGGMDDCKGTFATLQGAIDYVIKKQPSGWLDDTHVLEIGVRGNLMVHHIKPDTGTVEFSRPLSEVIGNQFEINEYMGEV
jgi:hypothetical protein